jgi:hypothetical protein
MGVCVPIGMVWGTVLAVAGELSAGAFSSRPVAASSSMSYLALLGALGGIAGGAFLGARATGDGWSLVTSRFATAPSSVVPLSVVTRHSCGCQVDRSAQRLRGIDILVNEPCLCRRETRVNSTPGSQSS